MTRSALSIAAAILLAALPAIADEAVRAGDLRIDGAWARATPEAARQGAAYLTVRNDSPTGDRLIGARTPAAARAELHTHTHDGGVMRMREVPAIEVEPGAAIALAPGGHHIMLIDLAAPLRDGARFPLTLRFERAGDVVVQIPVRRGPPAGSPPHSGH
jgi:copper(I)-binding protein